MIRIEDEELGHVGFVLIWRHVTSDWSWGDGQPGCLNSVSDLPYDCGQKHFNSGLSR